ncbi:MAG TPA: hypothetical protein VN317_09290 [Candidatus Methanoperedens sp.]|nr:hypothetical protein [Candidatus Methanoperedens sp.]
MSREVLEAIGRLRAQTALSAEQAAHLGRAARGELVSVRRELQIALWAGVTLIAGGAGLLVKENLAQLGPLTVGAGIALAAALCLWYVTRSASPFSWGPVASPTLAFDYVLLLGVLLIGTDLAWLETQLTLLGPNWPWHLLLLALVQLAFAFRYDSRAILSLALASFAAWRGVSLSLAGGGRFGAHDELLRLNAFAVGALFVAAGLLLRRAKRKAHFEPTCVNLGLVLLLGAAVAGSFDAGGGSEPLWGLSLAAASTATIFFAYRARRSDCFALGVVAAFLGLLRLAAELHLEEGYFFLVSAGSFGVLFLILRAHRRFREEP